MLTARRAFEDEDVSMTLSKVLQREPDLNALPADVPASVRWVLGVCLRKDPKQRMADIRDVRLALDGAFEAAAPRPSGPVAVARFGWRQLVLNAAAGAVLTAIIAIAVARTMWPGPPACRGC
jgi:hypothetical protein